MTTARTFLVPAITGVFEELGLAAAIRVGAHPSVWDGTGWYGIHHVDSELQFELEQGVELERVKYNVRHIERARTTGKVVLGEHRGLFDLFVPVIEERTARPKSKAHVPAVLVTGPFARRRPTGADIHARWRALTGHPGHASDPRFSHFVEVALATLVLEAPALAAFTQLLSSFGRLMGSGGTTADLSEEIDALRSSLANARLIERTWEGVRSMVEARSAGTWSSPHREGDLKRFGLSRAADLVMVGLFVSNGERDFGDDAVARDAFFRATSVLARRTREVISGRIGDYGVVLLSSRTAPRERRKQKLSELSERLTKLARSEFGLRLHCGLSSLPASSLLSEHYHAALRSAEFGLARGERLTEKLPTTKSAAFPLYDLGRELATLLREQPRELPALYERYLEAVASHAGYRLEAARGHLEAGYEQLLGALHESGAIEAKRLSEMNAEVALGARNARTLLELSAAYRRAVTDLAQAVEHPTDSHHDRSLRRAIEHVQRHYAEHIDRTTLAKIAGFAPDYFSRLFKRHEGKTFEEYLRRLRIDRSKQLLSNTDLSLSRVAELSGLGTRQYLGRVFKESVGVTPLAYRRKERRGDERKRAQDP